MRLLPKLPIAAVLFALIQAPAVAGLTPSFDTFGALPQANFGGSGIPNQSVAIRTIQDGTATITLGLTAHQRYSGPNLVNDGAGTFLADPGIVTQGSSTGATWNFAYYVNISGASSSGYQFKLDYDFDPGVGSEDLGTLNLGRITFFYTSTTWQDSQNLNFSIFDSGFDPGGFLYGRTGITPPSGSFDPYADGSYAFRLTAFKNGQQLGDSVSILVNVGDVGYAAPVPEPSTFVAGLLSIGLIAGGTWLRRSRRQPA